MSQPAPSSVAVVAAPMLRVLTLGDGNFSFSAALVGMHEGKKKPQKNNSRTKGNSQAKEVTGDDDAAASSVDAAAPSVNAHSEPPPFLASHRLQLIASSFDSAAALHGKYPEAAKLIEKVLATGATTKRLCAGNKSQQQQLRRVLHDVDATNLQRTLLPQLVQPESEAASSVASPAASSSSSAAVVPEAMKFDVIIFNHPHSGAEDLSLHASLLAHFFHSAAGFLRDDAARSVSPKSQVHVTLCQRQPEEWHLMESAARHGFRLLSRSEFLEAHYPSYETKRHHVNKTFAKRSIERMELLVFERAAGLTEAEAAHPVYTKAAEDPTFSHNALSRVIPLPPFKPTLPYEQAIAAIQAASAASSVPSAAASAAAPSLRTEITCSICSKGFSSERGLFYHTQQVHSAPDAADGPTSQHPQLLCSQCDPPRAFKDDAALQQHVIARHTAGSNSIAAADSSSSSSAAAAVPSASAAAPAEQIPCSICSFSFASPELLREHLEGVPPVVTVAHIECPVCGRLFSNARALAQHEKAASLMPETHVRIVLEGASAISSSDPALIGVQAGAARSKMKRLRGMVAKAEGSRQSVVERLGIKKGESTAPAAAATAAAAQENQDAAAHSIHAADGALPGSSAPVPTMAASTAVASASPAAAAAAPSAASSAASSFLSDFAPFPGLDEELSGSAREVDGLLVSPLQTLRRFRVVGEAPHSIQAVFAMRFREPPRAEEPEEQAKLDAAPREVCVGVCLPAGYASLVESHDGAAAAGEESSSSSAVRSFSFARPLVIKDTFHSLLSAVSPIYSAFKADELNRKLMQLFAKQAAGDD